MAKRINDLGRDPVGPLLLRLAIPSVTAQLVNALYNIVDRMYIGHIENEGALALTGLGVTFPVLMIISALSALVCVGGGSQAAIRMGEGNQERANEILGNCACLLLIFSVLVTGFFQLFKEPLLLLFGASENTIGYASDYLSIYLWGTVFVQCSVGLNFFISNQGFSTVSMRTVLLGAATNIVLDPIFIFGFHMGVRGAALATVIAQGVSAAWVLRFLTGPKTKLRIQKRYFRLRRQVLAPVLALGLSPFIMNATESALNIAFNSSLKRYGGDMAVCAMTISASIVQVMSTLFAGVSQGAQPIVSYNYGAGQSDRCRQVFRLLFTISLTLSTAFWLALRLVPGVFIAIFNDDPALVDYAVWAVQIYAAGLFIMGVQFSCQNAFVALGQAKISLFLALLRKCILLIPLIFILPRFFADQVFAVFLAEPVADILAGLTTGTLFFLRFPRILAAREKELAEKRPA
ncbi:MAG: MATE family efflux transporter [Oscillospiraceae bacterium]|nr:MATE family efflux transporter [Oscillospiraceae bacterium]